LCPTSVAWSERVDCARPRSPRSERLDCARPGVSELIVPVLTRLGFDLPAHMLTTAVTITDGLCLVIMSWLCNGADGFTLLDVYRFSYTVFQARVCVITVLFVRL
jgi:hypothetical protein